MTWKRGHDLFLDFVDQVIAFFLGMLCGVQCVVQSRAELLLNFLCERLRGTLGQSGDDSKRAGVGYRRSQFSETNVVHAALDDRVFDSKELGNSGAHLGLR